MKPVARLLFVLSVVYHVLALTAAAAEPPYSPSEVIEHLTWHWETHQTG